ncbi:tail fiber protein [Cohnella rhizosphaerae]|uniref:Tail fiber protein n=1 Tax=Cohnella rhizosphaerae TaxID=1457232 RepID=A0A9X4KR28_9BACL|nr:tail fiber protein [Cohnella rhizosphaerae]MDG0809255.1 tail fiber protein [Cohnella rhizosphaerae]
MYVSKKAILIVAGLLIALLSGASVYAATAATANKQTSTIYACAKGDGQIRLVAKGASCKKTEKAISWNVVGPKGDKGERGAAGPAGPMGAKGDTGATGPAGAAGTTGPTGATGPQGAKGDTGVGGPTGAAGPQGVKGDTGAAGPAGPQGPQGVKGDAGDAGATGPQGPKGDTGPAGAVGPQGAKGDTGPEGATGPQGPQGPPGTPGAAGPKFGDPFIADGSAGEGGSSAGYIGEVWLFAGNFAPAGTHVCDGSLLPIAQNTPLFALIGNQYGGDGKTTFALPDLQDYAPAGVSYVINISGIFPPR